jgi:hypothetical protein
MGALDGGHSSSQTIYMNMPPDIEMMFLDGR